MKWPLVWRSTMERTLFAENCKAFNAGQESAAQQVSNALDEATKSREAIIAEKAECKRFMDAYMNAKEAEAKTYEQMVDVERKAKADVTAAQDAQHRAEVRAQEWEAIAKELIARGAGRPKPDAEQKPENPVTKRIREEANGDQSLIAHWMQYARDLRKQGKKDEEIVGMIGWDTVNAPEAEAS